MQYLIKKVLICVGSCLTVLEKSSSVEFCSNVFVSLGLNSWSVAAAAPQIAVVEFVSA